MLYMQAEASHLKLSDMHLIQVMTAFNFLPKGCSSKDNLKMAACRGLTGEEDPGDEVT